MDLPAALRLVTWNVGYKKTRTQLTPALATALAGTGADVLVLTDYIDEPNASFRAALAAAGLKYRETTEPVKGQRQVIIAARESLERGDVEGSDLSAATKPNWLHIRTASGVNVVGFRVPVFSKAGGRAGYWQWLLTAALPQLFDQPSVLLGDFNVGSHYRPLMHAVAGGWQLATPSGGWSRKGVKGKPVAIDHALVSPHFRITKAEYVEALGDVVLAGTETAHSDHAALIVDLANREVPIVDD